MSIVASVARERACSARICRPSDEQAAWETPFSVRTQETRSPTSTAFWHILHTLVYLEVISMGKPRQCPPHGQTARERGFGLRSIFVPEALRATGSFPILFGRLCSR